MSVSIDIGFGDVVYPEDVYKRQGLWDVTELRIFMRQYFDTIKIRKSTVPFNAGTADFIL